MGGVWGSWAAPAAVAASAGDSRMRTAPCARAISEGRTSTGTRHLNGTALPSLHSSNAFAIAAAVTLVPSSLRRSGQQHGKSTKTTQTHGLSDLSSVSAGKHLRMQGSEASGTNMRRLLQFCSEAAHATAGARGH